jgi:glycosyltransferase involved in cell wall biosynthesis
VRISIIVPAFNEQKLIGRCLRRNQSAANAFTGLGWETEIIVCDNNSSDRTAEIARAAGAKVVFEPVNQIARARNTGAAAATGDWLLFVDGDSFPREELFAGVAAAIQSGEFLGGGATVKLDHARGPAIWMSRAWNLLSRLQKWMAGSFIFCDAAAFRELGGFSQQLFAAEEIEFSRRLGVLARRRGKKIIILHQHPLLTSARKVYLYSAREQVQLFMQTVWRRGRNLRDRANCALWYDGRR